MTKFFFPLTILLLVLFSMIQSSSTFASDPDITINNIREFKSLGWSVYSSQSELDSYPRKLWHYRTKNEKLSEAWGNNTNNINVLFSKNFLFSRLLDHKLDNDEIISVTVNKENYVKLLLETTNQHYGKEHNGRRVYLVDIKVDQWYC